MKTTNSRAATLVRRRPRRRRLVSSSTRASASSAPGDNAVVHWSGVAEAAISANPTPPPPPAAPGFRPPASSTVLAGMVHGAMYDAVARRSGGLKPFATAVRAPDGASADAAVAQAARDVLVARVPGQAANVQAAYDAFMAGIPDGAAKTGGKAVGAAAAAGMLAWRTGDHFDDVVPYVQRLPGPGSSSRSHRQLPWTRSCPTCALHVHRAGVPAQRAVPERPRRGAHHPAVRPGRRRAEDAGWRHRVRTRRRSRPRRPSSTAHRPTCSSAGPCARSSPASARISANRRGCWATPGWRPGTP